MKPLDLAAKATVIVTKKGGRGVLVNGNLILTAAHCITYECAGSMALGDYYIEDIKAGKDKLKVGPIAVEPIKDIAVLGALDGQIFYDECEQFELFCERTKPIPLCVKRYARRKPFPVHILNRNGKWINGSACFWGEDGSTVVLKSEKPIEGGASGGPIVNDSGELVGIVSVFGGIDSHPTAEGPAPYPYRALPVWVRDRILDKRT